jgi:hypothetical protein
MYSECAVEYWMLYFLALLNNYVLLFFQDRAALGQESGTRLALDCLPVISLQRYAFHPVAYHALQEV